MGCSKPITFDSRVTSLYPFLNEEPEGAIIKTEPMFFNSSVSYAMQMGGAVTRAFLSALPDGWSDAVFDSRIHMLMPGWYPSIPGWHHDDVPRAKKIPVGQHFATGGQPDYDNQSYFSEHIMGLANGGICPTEFAVGEAEMPAVGENETIYKVWHPEVQKQIEAGRLKLVKAPSLTLLQFDWQTFHQGTKARGSGWRWFGRVTRYSDRCDEITNEIRTQVQVYLEFPMEGW